MLGPRLSCHNCVKLLVKDITKDSDKHNIKTNNYEKHVSYNVKLEGEKVWNVNSTVLRIQGQFHLFFKTLNYFYTSVYDLR